MNLLDVSTELKVAHGQISLIRDQIKELSSAQKDIVLDFIIGGDYLSKIRWKKYTTEQYGTETYNLFANAVSNFDHFRKPFDCVVEAMAQLLLLGSGTDRNDLIFDNGRLTATLKTITIKFFTEERLLDFCKKHSIEYVEGEKIYPY